MWFMPWWPWSIASSSSTAEDSSPQAIRRPSSAARPWRKCTWAFRPRREAIEGMTELLQVRALDASYGDFQALFGVSMGIASGQVVAVIGANGAGKSTLLQSIAGL